MQFPRITRRQATTAAAGVALLMVGVTALVSSFIRHSQNREIRRQFDEARLKITETKEADIQFASNIAMSGHGMTVLLPSPFNARMAFRGSDFLFLHEPAQGREWARWVWLRDGELVLFELF